MNADEVVRIDEAVKALHRLSVLLVTPDSIVCCEAADLIESLQAQLTDYHHMSELVGGKMGENQRLRRINENLQEQLAASQRRAQDARNELCIKCGRYHEAHNGACDGCRWKKGME